MSSIEYSPALAKACAPTPAEALIEDALAAGMLDLADAAIRAIDDADAATADLEPEEDGDAISECVRLICACCDSRGTLGEEMVS